MVNGVSGVGIAVGTGANSGNATANTPQAVTASMASLPSVASVLGWAATGVE